MKKRADYYSDRAEPPLTTTVHESERQPVLYDSNGRPMHRPIGCAPRVQSGRERLGE